jgi:thiosulfate/3-mercaptopyruvate sulfurtransferase
MPIEQLVSIEWLAANLTNPNVRVIDVRWSLTERGSGRTAYLAAHIPGAAHLDIDADLSAPPDEGPGRHPLPAPEAFAVAAGRAGIGPDTHVIAYDASGGAYAARLWWLLRYFGHDQVSLLDGGWPAWQAANQPTESGETTIEPAIFTPHPRHEYVIDADLVDVLRLDIDTLLLDARATERYTGDAEPIDAQAGHIPGARSAPYAMNVQADGTMKSVDELRNSYRAFGIDRAKRVVCYCGSGVTAAHTIFALTLLGRDDALLYEGSWSDWSSDPERPIATGPDGIMTG